MNAEIIAGIYGIKNASQEFFPKQIHDHNVSVFQDGNLLNYIHLERISRVKYDANLHDHIEDIFQKLNLIKNKNTILCFADHELGKDFHSAGGKITCKSYDLTDDISTLKEGRANWFGTEVKAYGISHELAHIYSCIPFFEEFRDESLLIHYDGGASVSNFSAWEYNKKKISNLSCHWHLKQVTNLFNANPLVFRLTGTKPRYHNSVPGKFMGLASYGTYKPDIELWLRKNNFFSDIWSSPKGFFARIKSDWGMEINTVDTTNTFLRNIAATVHEVFVRESLKEILELKKKTKLRSLYFTGGCALNIKLNSALLGSGEFDEVFIPPCTNDSGLSLGAAVAASMHNGIKIKTVDPYLNNYLIENNTLKYQREDIKEIAKLIQANSVVGICNGFGEVGPRALGNRSLLARADSKELSQKISMRMKGREWYRPVAPVMLKKQAQYFTGCEEIPFSARYMLFDFKIRPDRIKEIAGVVHVDNTSRIQVMDYRNQNPFLYDLLIACYEQYGIRALINTSFNCKGEPIVHDSENAINSAKRM